MPALPEFSLARRARPARWLLAVLPLAAAMALASGAVHAAGPAAIDRSGGANLATAVVAGQDGPRSAGYDAVVEAQRQTVLAAQVAGAVVALNVKAGDRVKAGQVLARLDARAAEQNAAAGAAQVRAAGAGLEAASREYERQRQLFEKNYISRAALDRAEAQYKSAQAQAAAQLASAGAARTQTDFHVVKAPYDGVVAEVAVVLGDMAMPGRPLVTVYDPSALRVKAAIPQTVAARLVAGALPQVELPGSTAGRIQPVKAQLLPTVDAATHTLELRLDLPPGLPGATPGQFARAWLALTDGPDTALSVLAEAVVRRAELTAVYVVDAGGKPLLRQVRLGRAEAGRIEILSGLAAGERVALDPQAAARVR